MSAQDNTLDVWLNDDLGPARQVGTLAHDRGQIRFHYERDWLKDPRAFALDPDLSLDRVAERVRQGGHDIPESVIRRRFTSGWKNFQRRYRYVVDFWTVYDSAEAPPVLLEWSEKA